MLHVSIKEPYLGARLIDFVPGAAEAAAALTAPEHGTQWRDEMGLADPLDMTFPDLDPQPASGDFGDMFSSTAPYAFPSLPSGLVYTSHSHMNDGSEQYRSG